MSANWITAITITTLAGLATVLGSAFVKESRNHRLEAFTLAFATGIMLMLSTGELLPESIENVGTCISLIFFCLGVIAALCLDILIPHHHDHDEVAVNKEPGHYIDQCECSHSHSISQSMVMALLLHNILEGLATGLTAYSNSQMGISMAIGIALHNIPIGITIAVSAFSSGYRRSKALVFSTLIGLSQPLGAAAGLLLYRFTGTASFMASSQAVVAGILVFIAFDELWPAARKSGGRNLNIIALLAGICFIVITESI